MQCVWVEVTCDEISLWSNQRALTKYCCVYNHAPVSFVFRGKHAILCVNVFHLQRGSKPAEWWRLPGNSPLRRTEWGSAGRSPWCGSGSAGRIWGNLERKWQQKCLIIFPTDLLNTRQHLRQSEWQLIPSLTPVHQYLYPEMIQSLHSQTYWGD